MLNFQTTGIHICEIHWKKPMFSFIWKSLKFPFRRKKQLLFPYFSRSLPLKQQCYSCPHSSSRESSGILGILVFFVGRTYTFAETIPALIEFNLLVIHVFQKRSEEYPKTALSSNSAADMFMINGFQLYSSKRLMCSHRSRSQKEGWEGDLAGLG